MSDLAQLENVRDKLDAAWAEMCELRDYAKNRSIRADAVDLANEIDGVLSTVWAMITNERDRATPRRGEGGDE